MNITRITEEFSVSAQIGPDDIKSLAETGYKTIICNRPDGEEVAQHDVELIQQTATRYGIDVVYIPVVHSTISADEVRQFSVAWDTCGKPVLAYCRSGLRSTTLWALMQVADGATVESVVSKATGAGYDFSQFSKQFASIIAEYNPKIMNSKSAETSYDVLIVGAGAAGISVASSLLSRNKKLRMALIDPAHTHYYQPGFTMIGGGIFTPEQVQRPMASLIPDGVTWISSAVTAFEPDQNAVVLDDGTRINYQRLIVCPGIKLNWDGIEGLAQTLGRNGVTSNYRADLAPYTWKLISNMVSGKAVFTQPPMPIKCAGAPQKALYLAGDHWYRNGLTDSVETHFFNAGAVLFGVKDYVPALQSYIDKYKTKVHYTHKLVKVDGERKRAWFETTDAEGITSMVETDFDMLHVCPPQTAPDFIRSSPLADAAGWIDVDPATLQHKRYPNIWALGDATNTSNAKTAAAVRVQAPVVAANIISDIAGQAQLCQYNGYGSCPLTVERGKIVLAEFIYGGKVKPTLPVWMLDGTKPTSMAWHMKKSMLPALYWHGMLKGHELMVKPVVG
ncbi:MAG: TIGR01244 family sulfur transferase [Pseudohongiella sp.]|nr:TIGR01244 family sulfur transferase [Pseudohongiella sp.]